MYRARVRIEQLIGNLSGSNGWLTRCEKTRQNYAAFVSLACVLIVVKAAHRA